MIKKLKLVSVIMPVYNGELFVEKAIESILNQTYPRIELIVVDDGSIDKTWKILKKYRQKFPKIIRIFRLKENQGESTAANLAFSKTKGDYIARMDADDISHKQRIAKQVDFLNSHVQVIAVGTQAKVINKRGWMIGEKKFPLTNEKIYNLYAVVHPMLHPSLMFRRAMLPANKPLYRNQFEPNDDYYTLFELLRFGQFANLPEKLLSYRVHGANKSLGNLKAKFWNTVKIRWTAITKLQYKAPFYTFFVMLAQILVVSVLPETVLTEMLLYSRGLKKLHLPIPRFTLDLAKAKMKEYADLAAGYSSS